MTNPPPPTATPPVGFRGFPHPPPRGWGGWGFLGGAMNCGEVHPSGSGRTCVRVGKCCVGSAKLEPRCFLGSVAGNRQGGFYYFVGSFFWIYFLLIDPGQIIILRFSKNRKQMNECLNKQIIIKSKCQNEIK